MTNNLKFRASDDVVAREVGGEMVLLDLASGLYFGLDPIGSRVWQKLSESSMTLNDLVNFIEAEFDASRDRIEHDLAALLEQFTEKQLITADPA